MPARDLFHGKVRVALEKDGWTITADPYTLVWGKDSLFVDLAAERFIAAEKENEKIAVEIKSFIGRRANRRTRTGTRTIFVVLFCYAACRR